MLQVLIRGAPGMCHRGEDSGKPQAVVGVEVRDEHLCDTAECHATVHHLPQRALGTRQSGGASVRQSDADPTACVCGIVWCGLSLILLWFITVLHGIESYCTVWLCADVGMGFVADFVPKLSKWGFLTGFEGQRKFSWRYAQVTGGKNPPASPAIIPPGFPLAKFSPVPQGGY